MWGGLIRTSKIIIKWLLFSFYCDLLNRNQAHSQIRGKLDTSTNSQYINETHPPIISASDASTNLILNTLQRLLNYFIFVHLFLHVLSTMQLNELVKWGLMKTIEKIFKKHINS
jgi:hypothetical protein